MGLRDFFNRFFKERHSPSKPDKEVYNSYKTIGLNYHSVCSKEPRHDFSSRSLTSGSYPRKPHHQKSKRNIGHPDVRVSQTRQKIIKNPMVQHPHQHYYNKPDKDLRHSLRLRRHSIY